MNISYKIYYSYREACEEMAHLQSSDYICTLQWLGRWAWVVEYIKPEDWQRYEDSTANDCNLIRPSSTQLLEQWQNEGAQMPTGSPTRGITARKRTAFANILTWGILQRFWRIR